MKNNDHIRNELIKMIRNHNARVAIDSAGGYDRFKRIMGIDTIEDYLSLFNDLELDKSTNGKKCILYKYGNNIKMSMSDGLLIIKQIDFDPLTTIDYMEREDVLRNWVSEVFKIKPLAVIFLIPPPKYN